MSQFHSFFFLYAWPKPVEKLRNYPFQIDSECVNMSMCVSVSRGLFWIWWVYIPFSMEMEMWLFSGCVCVHVLHQQTDLLPVWPIVLPAEQTKKQTRNFSLAVHTVAEVSLWGNRNHDVVGMSEVKYVISPQNKTKLKSLRIFDGATINSKCL